MQKLGTQTITKPEGSIDIMPAPRRLHMVANRCLPGTFVQEIAAFQIHLQEDGKGSKTVESYVGDVTGFLTYMHPMGMETISGLRRFHITAYRTSLLEQGLQPSTINKKINSLQSFNRYLVEKGIVAEHCVDPKRDKVKVASGSEREVETFGQKVLERLLFYIQGSEVNSRDRAVMMVLLYTGVRVSELCDIKLKNIDFLTGQLRVLGKGGKVREVPLKTEVVEAIREYLADRGNNPYADSERLFLGQRGPLQRDAVNTLLEKHSARAGLDIRLKPHAFRHTFCTMLINKGVPLTTVSKLAGHSSVDTTARYYINSSKEDKMRAVKLL